MFAIDTASNQTSRELQSSQFQRTRVRAEGSNGSREKDCTSWEKSPQSHRHGNTHDDDTISHSRTRTRGRGDRARFLPSSSSPSNTMSSSQPTTVKAEPPTYSHQHGMNIYDPNQVSWPTEHTYGYQDESQYTARSRTLSRSHTPQPAEQFSTSIHPHSQLTAEQPPVHQSRPASRHGYTPTQQRYQQQYHSAQDDDARLHSNYAPIGTPFEIVYSESHPSDTSATPTWSADHSMHLYNPNEVSWPGGVPPPDRKGLKPHTSTGHAADDSYYIQSSSSLTPEPSMPVDSTQSSRTHLHAREFEDEHDLESIHAPSRTVEANQPASERDEGTYHPDYDNIDDDQAVDGDVYIGEDDRRAAGHYVTNEGSSGADAPLDSEYVTHFLDTDAVNSRLPPVAIDPRTGFPVPVYSPHAGMNLYIPSEVSWANGVMPIVGKGHFDRGFRQQPHYGVPTSITNPQPKLHPYHHPVKPIDLSQSQPLSATTVAGGVRPKTPTLGPKIQVAFDYHDHTLPAVGPQSARSSSRPSSSGSYTARMATPPTSAPLSASHERYPQSARGRRRSGVGAEIFAPSGTQFETVYSERYSDPTAPPTYSEAHGMHLYNPNEVSWAGNTPPADRKGLKVGGPVKVKPFSSSVSRPSTGHTSPLDTLNSPTDRRRFSPIDSTISPSVRGHLSPLPSSVSPSNVVFGKPRLPRSPGSDSASIPSPPTNQPPQPANRVTPKSKSIPTTPRSITSPTMRTPPQQTTESDIAPTTRKYPKAIRMDL